VRAEGQELHGRVEFQRPEDEPVVLELGEAEVEGIADAHSEDGWVRRLIGDRGVVVAVDDGDGVGRQQRLHAGGLLGRDAHGDEAGPSAA
jgi:hypothetical protein